MTRLLADAWNDLRRNLAPLAIYLGLVMLVSTAYRGANEIAGSFVPEDGPAPPWLPAYQVIADLFIAAGYAAVQASVFSAMGREIDRPLWKSPGLKDALRRFFMVWFLLNLAMIAVIRMQVSANSAGLAGLVLWLEFLLMLFFVFAVPIGACVMYWGRLNWRELPEALAPIGRMLPLTMAVFMLTFSQFVLHFFLVQLVPKGVIGSIPAMAIADVPFAFLDCFAFAAMWRLCMAHRNADFENDLDMFD